MNFTTIFSYFGILTEIVTAFESIAASIKGAQAAETPPIYTYLFGMHGAVQVVWTPLTQPAVGTVPTVAAVAAAAPVTSAIPASGVAPEPSAKSVL